jgi:NAD(P)H-dependent FMN reductase
MRVLFLVSSPREDSNSQALAQVAAQSLPSHAQAVWLHLREYPLEPFLDLRHVVPINPDFPLSGGYSAATGNAQRLLEETLSATHLVFVAPVHWYSVPTLLKRYLDEWSAWLRIPNLGFKAQMGQKRYFAIAVSSAGSPEEAEPLFATLELSARYFGASLERRLLGRGSKPNDVLADTVTLEAAKVFFEGVI